MLKRKSIDVDKHHCYYEGKTREVSEASSLLLLSSNAERSQKLLGSCNGFSAFPQDQTKGEISLILGEKEDKCDSDVCLFS